ncbi:MAG: ArsR family transcriptional regulator [Lachnospiraceae bacterium]|nr:ArsR family transcriptional regulator [Lachnospiraceae bacterium]
MAQIDACIYGRKVKKAFEIQLKDVREKNDLKQIEVEILLYFYENEGKTASDLYRELGLNKGQVSTGLDNLTKMGMLKCYTNSDDRRYLQYELLDKGKEIAREVVDNIIKVYDTVLDGFSDEQKKAFYDMGIMICQNIDRYY